MTLLLVQDLFLACALPEGPEELAAAIRAEEDILAGRTGDVVAAWLAPRGPRWITPCDLQRIALLPDVEGLVRVNLGTGIFGGRRPFRVHIARWKSA